MYKNKPPVLPEAVEQEQLFQIAQYHVGTYPELALMYAIPNGGSRHLLEAVNLQRQGVKAGVPDICLPIPRGGYGALYIEMKREKGGTVQDNQRDWQKKLINAGNAAFICKGCEEAWKVILAYLHQRLEKSS